MPQALLASLSDGQSTYTWDPWNRLAGANTSGTTTSYSYDQAGQRVTQSVKKGGGATTTTTYFNRYYEKTGATTTLYVFLPTGELLATIEGSGSATSTYIAHTDHLNSSSVLSDKNGSLAQLSTYYPYGSIRSNDKPSSGFDEKRKYIGQFYDDATTLSYLNARYYDGTRGQFLSEDPLALKMGLPVEALQKLLLDPQQQNFYSYARNNPINLSDPNGEATQLTAQQWSYFQAQINYIQRQIDTLRSQMNVVSNVISSAVQPAKSAPVSTALLTRSVTGGSAPVNITTSNQQNYGNVITAIQKAPEFKAYVEDQIKSKGKNGSINTRPIDDDNSFAFKPESGDLYTALHNVNAGLSGQQSEDGKWKLQVSMTDYYDFKWHSVNGLISTGIDMAVIGQKVGIVSNYPINISFDYTYKPQ